MTAIAHAATKARFIGGAYLRHWTTQARMDIHDMRDATSRRLGIVTVFQPEGLSDNTKSFLATLHKDLGFDVVVVSNAPLLQSDLNQLATCCTKVIVRANRGFELGALKDILPCVRQRLRTADELLLTNDSIIGPVRDLSPIFADMARRPCDFWALENREAGVHGSSTYLVGYFLVLRQRLLSTGTFEDFVASCSTPVHRRQAISRHEKGLTRFFVQRGFHPDAFITAATIREACGRLRNQLPRLLDLILRDPLVRRRAQAALRDPHALPPASSKQEEALFQCATEFLVTDCPARFLLLECGLPFVKKDLLKRGLATAGDIRDVVEHITGDSLLARYAEVTLERKSDAARAHPYLCSRGYI